MRRAHNKKPARLLRRVSVTRSTSRYYVNTSGPVGSTVAAHPAMKRFTGPAIPPERGVLQSHDRLLGIMSTHRGARGQLCEHALHPVQLTHGKLRCVRDIAGCLTLRRGMGGMGRRQRDRRTRVTRYAMAVQPQHMTGSRSSRVGRCTPQGRQHLRAFLQPLVCRRQEQVLGRRELVAHPCLGNHG